MTRLQLLVSTFDFLTFTPMTTLQRTNSAIVPENLDATQWENLKPLYQALLDRTLKCEGCLEKLILDRSELDSVVSEAAAVLYITMTQHTDDAQAKSAYLSFIENVEPHLKTTGFALDKKVVQSPHATKLDQDRYGVMLRDLQADVEIFRPENVPLQTQDTKLGQQYSEICGAMTVQFQGKEHTLPQMARYLEDTDRTTREQAWKGMTERRHQDQQKLNDIFDQMVALRDNIARNAGFSDYRAYMFKAKHRFDYTPEDCLAFHEAVEREVMLIMETINNDRVRELNINPLRPWDLSVDVKGRSPLRPFESADVLIDKCSKLFHRMDPALGAMFDRLRTGDSLDLESRKGKAPGGYQYNRDYTRQPFIFMNAAGLHRDLVTMLHEAGHAFHSMLCDHDPLLHYRHVPTEFAEVASISMELLSYPYLDEFYSKDDASRAKRNHLEKMVSLLPWIATIDAFQHWIYTNPGHSQADRRTYWESLMKRFGSKIDWAGLEEFRAVSWQAQLHLFEVPFYYIEYAIAQLGAQQLWLQAKSNEKSAVQHYQRALRLGGSKPLPELFKAAELKFDFTTATVRELMADVRREIEKLPV